MPVRQVALRGPLSFNVTISARLPGLQPPPPPPTAVQYTRAGLQWFDHYAESDIALDGAEKLRELKSVIVKARELGTVALPEKESVASDRVMWLRDARPKTGVREGLS